MIRPQSRWSKILKCGNSSFLSGRCVRIWYVATVTGRDRPSISPVYSATSVVGQVGLVEDLAHPLLDGGDAGGEDQRRFLHERHGGDADDGLARAARQHDDAAAAAHVAAGVEDVGRVALVVADVERQAGAGHVAQLRSASAAPSV